MVYTLKGQLPDIETPLLGTFSDPIIFKLHRGVFLSVLKNFRKKNFKNLKGKNHDFSTFQRKIYEIQRPIAMSRDVQFF